MKGYICSKCKEKPVSVKKYWLCKTCYAEHYRNKNKSRIAQYQRAYAKQKRLENQDLVDVEPAFSTNQKAEELFNLNEKLFVRNFFAHDEWVHQPCTFRLGNMTYTPDFYDKVRNTFIEVAGTKQAFHQNKYKYAALIEEFPLIKFEVRQVSGVPIDLNFKIQNWPTPIDISVNKD